MNMYKEEIIKTLEQEVLELKGNIRFFRERTEHNHNKMRKCQSQLSEALEVLKQLKGGVYNGNR